MDEERGGKPGKGGKKEEPRRVTGDPMEAPALKRLDEAALVRDVLAGSHQACRTLVETYQDRLFGLVSRFTRDPQEREDLVQEVFLKVFRNLARFKFDSALFTWIYRIAVNAASDHFAAARRRPLFPVEDLEALQRGLEDGAEGAPPAAPMLAEERRKVTRQVLSRLPEIFRQVLVMREYEDLSYQRIADMLGISIGTVESRLFRARRKFAAEADRLYPGFFPAGRKR